MKKFRDWVREVESAQQEVSFQSSDVAGNPYGAGPTYVDPKRRKRWMKENPGLGHGLAQGVQKMKFSSGPTASERAK